MKRVIKGKLYNEATAEKLYHWNNGYFGDDFKSCEETLYKTQKSAYFIAGSGGAQSKYAVSRGNSIYGGEDIKVLSKKEALEWLSTHGGSECIEEHFSDMIQEA